LKEPMDTVRERWTTRRIEFDGQRMNDNEVNGMWGRQRG